MMIPDRCCIGPANGFLISSPLRRPPTALQEPPAVGFASRQRTPPTPLDGEHGLARRTPNRRRRSTAAGRDQQAATCNGWLAVRKAVKGSDASTEVTDRGRVLPAHQPAHHGLARELPSRTHWQALDADHQPPI
jgi:hypothetical protein